MAVLLTTATSSAGCRRSEGAGKSPTIGGPLRVTVTPVAPRTFVRTLEVDGNLEPAERVLVAPSIPGVIRKITKRAGDPVHKGELLVEVDPKEVYVGTIQLRVSLAQARARARAASEVLRRLREPVERLRRLYRAKAISKTELDKVEIPYVQARAQRDAAERIIRKVHGELGIAYSKLSDTRIVAPFDGFVVRRLVDPGEVARAFPPTVVLVLTRHHPLYVQAEVGERDAPRLRRGQRVFVRIEALPGAPRRPGVVEDIIPYVNPMTRTVTVRIRVDNQDRTLMPGMSARLRIPLAPSHPLAIPARALATEPLEGKASVFVVSGGRARERAIRFGRAQGAWLEVLDGLRPGESVVVTGHEPLVDGAAVVATPATVPETQTSRAQETSATARRAASPRTTPSRLAKPLRTTPSRSGAPATAPSVPARPPHPPTRSPSVRNGSPR